MLRQEELAPVVAVAHHHVVGHVIACRRLVYFRVSRLLHHRGFAPRVRYLTQCPMTLTHLPIALLGCVRECVLGCTALGLWECAMGMCTDGLELT